MTIDHNEHPHANEQEPSNSQISKITERITRVTSFESFDSAERLLDVAREDPTIRGATLWKIKRRSKSLCAKARTHNFFNPDPLDANMANAFVCVYRGSILNEVIESDSFRKGDPYIIDDVNDYKDDPFFGPALSRGEVNLKKAIILPVKSFKRQSEFNPSYILLIYVEFGFETREFDSYLLQSISNKAGNTLSTQIEIKLNAITDYIKTTATESASLHNILAEFMGAVIPKYFCFTSSLLIWKPPSSSRYALRFYSDHSGTLSAEIVDAISDFCLGEFDRIKRTSIHFQTCSLAKIASVFSNAKSILVSPIRNSHPGERPHGFIILVDKLNPLARQKNDKSRIIDFFDWEDELIIDHAASLMSMIAELTHAEDRHKQLADQIAHEMVMPANAVIGKTQSVLGKADKLFDISKGIPPAYGKIREELQEILTYASLQMALCDGILMGLQDEDSSPSLRYNPENLDLTELVQDVASLVEPFCRSAHVSFKNITVSRTLPRLFVDRSAFTQIFLNLLTNAIKYVGPNPFSAKVDAEDMPASQLTEDVLKRHPFRTKFSDREKERQLEGGFVITVEDSGIGVSKGYEERIFARHFRVPGVEQFAARGSGLGLAIVRRIVSDHGGVIWLENGQKPTKFAIYLPRRLARREYINDRAWRGNPK
jgi:signal transduction histidine kinase